jgi:hypothetical protein
MALMATRFKGDIGRGTAAGIHAIRLASRSQCHHFSVGFTDGLRKALANHDVISDQHTTHWRVWC